jgi:hypothetical protein
LHERIHAAEAHQQAEPRDPLAEFRQARFEMKKSMSCICTARRRMW